MYSVVHPTKLPQDYGPLSKLMGALLVEKNTFNKYVIKNHIEAHSNLTRELAIENIL